MRCQEYALDHGTSLYPGCSWVGRNSCNRQQLPLLLSKDYSKCNQMIDMDMIDMSNISNKFETSSNQPASPAEPQVAESTRLRSGRYRHRDLHRQRDVHLSWQSKWPSATMPQSSKEKIRDHID